MEQSCALLDERDAQVFGRLEDGAVVLRARRSGNVFDTTPGGAVDIVDKGELFYMLSARAITKKPKKG